MIWQSSYWKKDLLKIADILEKRTNQKKWFDASNANAEKEIMISAFMIRKLFESRKIDSAIENKLIKITKYKANGKKISVLRRLSPERYFDMEKAISSTISVKDIYNNIIHSYVFQLLFIDKEFKYFCIASDRNRFRFMFEIKVIDYINILKEIGNYWPKSELWVYDDEKEDYVVTYKEDPLNFSESKT